MTPPTTSLYDESFFIERKDGSYNSAQQIVPLLRNLIGMKSVCDVGCGIGTWLAAFIEEGVSDVLGMDGEYVDKKMLQIPSLAFLSTDLNRHFSVDRTFDAVISLEVGEHLTPERAEGFVKDLTALSKVIIFSAAIPGQGGTGHINEQWPDYWEKLFKQNGFVCVDAIRQTIWNNETIEVWYRQNMFVFCDYRVLSKFPKLMKATNQIMPLCVVHPHQYAYRIDYMGSLSFMLKSFPHALMSAVTRRLK
jgi:hypothetical protein